MTAEARSTRSDARRAVARRAEEAVVDHLLTRGFSVLDRNARLGALEIDVVAQREDLVVLVEVRTRGPGSFVRALASISPKKQATMLRAADRIWHERFAANPAVSRIRIDVAAVTFDGTNAHVEYIEAALSR